MFGVIARLRSFLRSVRRGDSLDTEMAAEFQHHMEMRAADLRRSGLSADDAARQARAEFGGTYNYQQRARESHGLRWFDALRFSWLDFKLGARMLVRFPGLTIIGSLAMGVAIAIGAGAFGVIATVIDPRLPLEEGDRVVGIQMYDIATRGAERRIIGELADWKALRTIPELAVFRPSTRNLVTPDGRGIPIVSAEMTAVGFRVARVGPLLGRYLIDDDEAAGASPVVVVGHDLWRTRFLADSSIVGRRIRLGATEHTVVGVMPPGFAFPVNYAAWVPLRINVAAYQRRSGPALFVVGRLADDATMENARHELATLAAAVSREHPKTHANLRARVLPFRQSWMELDSPDVQRLMRIVPILVTLLLVVISVNLAILVYARTATRHGEIAVRSALGATRGRIVAHLLGESLVLAALGALVGLALVQALASRLPGMIAQLDVLDVPFWFRFELSPMMVAAATALATLAAVIMGVFPALRLTGRRVQASLQRLAGGHATVRMGKLWTALIVAEVALAVAILPFAVRFAYYWLRTATAPAGFTAEQYLAATLDMERIVPVDESKVETSRALASRYVVARDELLDRLRAEQAVIGATYAAYAPGAEPGQGFAPDDPATRDSADASRRDDGYRVRHAAVHVGYFDVFDVPVLAGRSFAAADGDASSSSVIVNAAFVDSVFQGRNAVGRRIRTVGRSNDGSPEYGPWLNVVGVVADFPLQLAFDRPMPAVYQAAGVSRAYGMTLTIRVRGDPAAWSERFRMISAATDPSLVLRRVRPIQEHIRASYIWVKWLAIGIGAVTLSVLVLSAAGVFALMSVVVTQRRREIGIRIALGADKRRVLSTIFSRVATQLAVGIVLGLALGVLFDGVVFSNLFGPGTAVIVGGVALFMTGVGVLAALAPARRGLRIQPTEALKSE